MAHTSASTRSGCSLDPAIQVHGEGTHLVFQINERVGVANLCPARKARQLFRPNVLVPRGVNRFERDGSAPRLGLDHGFNQFATLIDLGHDAVRLNVS